MHGHAVAAAPHAPAMRRAAATRLACALAYPPLAYWAAREGSGGAAAIALADLVLVFLAGPLLGRRAWAWGAAAALGAGLGLLARTGAAQLLLLAPPVLFLAALAYLFARGLRPPRQALITHIVAALHGVAPAQLPAQLLRYTRRLTGAWALLLALLATVNGVLALCEVPGGVLAELGHAPAWGVPRDTGALLANLVNYGVVGVFFVGEYLFRGFVFPERPYRNFFDFLRRMGRLGPEFWRGALR